jgi:hypothetical protein
MRYRKNCSDEIYRSAESDFREGKIFPNVLSIEDKSRERLASTRGYPD